MIRHVSPVALVVAFLTLTSVFTAPVSLADAHEAQTTEQNKRLARAFYNDLWFSDQTDNYTQYVADSYVVHDIGERKNVTESAHEQKEIADFFWKNGTLSGDIQYQVAEGDLVATRWTARFEPKTLVGRFMIGAGDIPIINVFRFDDGKIVEVWNHRHDIDTPQTMKYTIRGLLAGLAVALIPTIWALRMRRRLQRARVA